MPRRRPARRDLAPIAILVSCLVPGVLAAPSQTPFYDDMTVDQRMRISSERTAVAQRQAFLWEDRRTIGLIVQFDSSGAVTGMELKERHGSAREADSVLAVARAWRFPHGWARDRREGRWPAVVVLDRAGNAHRDRSQPVPPAIAELLLKHPLAEWLQALQSIHPEASTEYFRSYGSWHMFKVRAVGMLGDEMLRRKASCSMLLESPAGTYVLDPFVGFEVYEECGLGADVDTGFSIFQSASGDRTWYDVSTTESIHVAAWADDSTFVMAGTGRIENADRSLATRVPLLWVGDASNGIMRRYIGAPMDPLQEEGFWRQILIVMRNSYPRVRYW